VLFKGHLNGLACEMKIPFLICLTTIGFANSALFAENPLDLQNNDTMHAVLERQVGKSIELRLKSGEKIAGKLEKVTGALALMTQLSEATFYDAAVDVESVAAVVVRARSN